MYAIAVAATLLVIVAWQFAMPTMLMTGNQKAGLKGGG